MADEKKLELSSRLPRDLRYRRQLFPEGDRLVFNTDDRGFVPVPIILRKLFRFLTSPEVRVLLYLHLRCSRFGICYPPVDEIVHELGLTSRKNLLPHIASLVEKQFISVRTSGNKTFYLVHDPRVAIMHLQTSGQLRDEDIFELNDLYADLNQAQIPTSSSRTPSEERIV